MNIKIVGRKVNLRENFKELVQRKLSKFDRIFDEDRNRNAGKESPDRGDYD